MVFALVHFTVGFIVVLTVLSAVPVTRHRLTGAYLGGVWALGPDLHHVVDGALGERFRALHWSPHADWFFLHYTLDGEVYRAHNVELTFVSIAVLGIAFLAYDRQFGASRSAVRRFDTADASEEPPGSD